MEKSEIIKRAEDMYTSVLEIRKESHFPQVLFDKENMIFSVYEHVDSSSRVQILESDM